ncbi:aldehyde dehydrogenase family protein [Streptomyces roseolus]|uniref:aldehyde dehydrogenase family protein n=1 Tax=Streptomyces roseolus TaxID=67358 RepID=UPI003796A4D8
MSTVKEQTEEPPPPVAAGIRPSWMTDRLFGEGCAGVHRGAGRLERHAAGQVIALAPCAPSPVVPVPACVPADVGGAIAEARVAQREWARLPLAWQDEMLDLIQWETGQARCHAWQEVLQVANIAWRSARRVTRYLSRRRMRGMVADVAKVREVRVPKEGVGVVLPWKCPLSFGVGDVFPGLLARHAVVSKADDPTALTVLRTWGLLDEEGLPAGTWRVVGSSPVGAVDVVCFTGSTTIGRGAAKRAARRLVGCSLERRRKNPLIVRADVDLAAAVADTGTGTGSDSDSAAIANAGQMGDHLEYVSVHEQVCDIFRDRLLRAARALPPGRSCDSAVGLGALISLARLATVEAHVGDAAAEGAKGLMGGRALPAVGPFVHAPTVLEGVTPVMAGRGVETFGPVVSWYPYATGVETLDRADEGSYGLSASAWSHDTRTAARNAGLVRAGAVDVDGGAADAVGSVEAGGEGVGCRRVGRRHGTRGILECTRSQAFAVQRLMPLGLAPGRSPEDFVHRANGRLSLHRRLRVR